MGAAVLRRIRAAVQHRGRCPRLPQTPGNDSQIQRIQLILQRFHPCSEQDWPLRLTPSERGARLLRRLLPCGARCCGRVRDRAVSGARALGSCGTCLSSMPSARVLGSCPCPLERPRSRSAAPLAGPRSGMSAGRLTPRNWRLPSGCQRAGCKAATCSHFPAVIFDILIIY